MKRVGEHPKGAFSFRRNVLPPLLGLVVMLAVMGIINGQYISAQLYYRYGSNDTTITSAPASNLQLDPNAAPVIAIPTIGVKAPVIFEPSYKESQVQLALRRGVVKFATTADPGQNGNVVIFGHSSGQPWAPGDYKFVFTALDRLKPGDKIYIDYKGQRYIYQMASSQVVLPEEVGVINPTDKPTLTLITCSPVGTSLKRLVVRANQISPKPAITTEVTASTTTQPAKPASLPNGEQTSFWQSIRELF
jgi:sortase A